MPINPADCRMGDLVERFDWSATPLGPRQAWPERLRFALDLCLASSAAAAVYWGPELIFLYNDAFAQILGEGHPRLLGRPAREVWGDSWDWIGRQFEQVIESGEGLSIAEQMVPLVRGGLVEETYWNCSFTPIRGEGGEIEGVFGLREEVTRAVLAERRLSFQIRVADGLRGEKDAEAVKHAATRLLGEYLAASRVGYAEVDEDGGTAWVRSDWTREPGVLSLAGQKADLAAFGAEALALLRAGEVLAIPDIRALLGAGEIRERWEAIGMRALITVPRVHEGALKALLFVHEPQPRQWRRSEAAMARDVAERTWAAVERAQAEQGLRDSEDHYRHTVELNPQVTWTALPDGQLNRVANRWSIWTGTNGLGDSWAEAIHPDDRERTFETWRESVATGETYDIEHRVRMRDGSYRWARSRAFPRRCRGGSISLWYGTTEDIQERKAAEDRQRLLINELNHRVKNTLATVQAIAFQTLKGDIPVGEGRSRFEARLMALSRAHNLLTEQSWRRAALHRVVQDATEHVGGDQGRFAIAGDAVWLSPRAALALSLALHELGTNAAKYGALSNETGRVAVRWRFDEARLTLDWKETGGPPIASPPERRGFGSRLIEQGLEGELGGTARIAFEPDGLRCTIHAAADAVASREAADD